MCAWLRRCWPAPLTSSIKVSVTEPGVPGTSAGQQHRGPVGQAALSGQLSGLRLMGASQGIWDVVWLSAARQTWDFFSLILARDKIREQKVQLLGLKRFDECKKS